MNTKAQKAFRTSATTTAMLVILAPAQAAEVDEVTELSKPESSVSIGGGYVSKDNLRYGQYTGQRDEGGYGLLDFNVVQRDDATGTCLRIDGRNLGLENRELRFEHNRQGDWGYFFGYSETPRYNPYTVNTELSGIGGTTQTVDGEAFRDVELKTERKTATLGYDKWLPAGFDVQVRFRNEEKTGSRLFGRANFDFLAEPIDSSSQGLDAILGYTSERLQMAGGYYGSWYNNHNSRIDVVGGSSTFTPIALPPDNEFHQLHLAGGYSFTPTTRGTFKLAYGRATQDDAFIDAPAANPNLTGKSSLQGRVDTTQMQMGLSTRPMPKLSLLANLRYEDRDDKTPIVRYVNAASGNTFDGLYEPRSIKTIAGKIEASYQLPMGYRLTGGMERDRKERFVPFYCGTSGCGSLASVTAREETDETTYRLQLRRSLSETVNGAVSYAHSYRNGSEYPTTVVFVTGNSGSNLIAPPHVADRQRDRWRVMADWATTENLSLQFAVEDVKEDYHGRDFGPRKNRAQNYSIDAAYTVTDNWQATAWVSRNETDSEQTTQCVSSVGSCGVVPNVWSAKLGNEGDAVGVGVRGKIKRFKEVGADLQYASDRGTYNVSAASAIPASITLPPDSNFRTTRLKLFADYPYQKNAGLRFDYAYERRAIDDWTWTTWVYSDGTRVIDDPKQSVHFVGVTVYYRWW